MGLQIGPNPKKQQLLTHLNNTNFQKKGPCHPRFCGGKD